MLFFLAPLIWDASKIICLCLHLIAPSSRFINGAHVAPLMTDLFGPHLEVRRSWSQWRVQLLLWKSLFMVCVTPFCFFMTARQVFVDRSASTMQSTGNHGDLLATTADTTRFLAQHCTPPCNQFHLITASDWGQQWGHWLVSAPWKQQVAGTYWDDHIRDSLCCDIIQSQE